MTKIEVNVKILNFDMDGTIADLYGFSDWLPLLRQFSTLPYEGAKPLVPMDTLARHLCRLQAEGYRLRVISWGSMDSTPAYDEAVRVAKEDWLSRYLPTVHWDEICVVPYGTPKHEVGAIPGGILFDDSVPVRRAWGDGAFDEEHILSVLRRL